MPETILTTKLHIPPLHGRLIKRPYLIQRLNDGIAQNHRLTLISAPAGYGKSTLISEWISQLGFPAAWLSLEKEENTPIRFWSYFMAALSTIPALRQAGIGEGILRNLTSVQPPPMAVILTNLLNELSNVGGEAILVLDDLHTIAEGQIHHDLVFLVEQLLKSAHGLHLVVTSRMDPPWLLARWRARNAITELRSSDLRFTYDEVFQFLNQVLQLKLSEQDIAALQERTEGWIAGLQMAALSIQGRLKSQGTGEVARFIESFTGSHRFILDYLLEEVISQQPVEICDFLYATSIVDEFTASLGDTLLGRQDGQAMLEQVENDNLFLIPLDDERHWYRYHHLFTDLLRKQLKQTQPDRLIELHQRASEWYAQNGLLVEAISHAWEAGDVVRVNKLIAGNALAMVEYAELMKVLRYFEHIPEEEICSKPWLCMAYIWVKAYVDPSGDLDQYLLKTMQSVSTVEDEIEKEHLTSHLDAVWAYVAWVKGKADLALEFAHTALASLPKDDWLTRTHLLNIEGLALQNLGHLAEAIQSFRAAVAMGQKMERPHASFFSYTNWAYAAILQGQLHQAYSLCQHVLSLADQANLLARGLPILAYAYATMSMVQCEWNQVETAVSSARQGVGLAEQWRQADTLHFTLTCLSEALRAAGDFQAALSANQQAMQLAAGVSPWYYRISICEEIMLNLAKENLVAARQLFAELEPLVNEQNETGLFLVIKASLLYGQGKFAEVIAAIDGPIRELERRGEVWTMMRILTLQAVALHALDREAEALQVLARCLAYAEPEGVVRIFMDRGIPMLELLQLAARRGIYTEYVNRLLPEFKMPEITQQAPLSPLHSTEHSPFMLEPLSKRELQVLQLLDSALTSEQIAQELYISTHTVRTHIKNIYSKLAVHGRLEAIQKAKATGLM